jgi:hypothetical protein
MEIALRLFGIRSVKEAALKLHFSVIPAKAGVHVA